tara:strand:- start:30246 stop:30704 length:459 start_codon:yes stop_codon:yes gene_type:complete
MIKSLTFIFGLLMSMSLMADPAKCLYPLRSPQGLNPLSLNDSFLIKIHKTLAGELDPFVLGDGGLVTGTWLAGAKPISQESVPFFIIFEGDIDHPNTTKIDEAYYKGVQFFLIKANCLAQMKNEKQIKAVQSLVTRHMKPPKGSYFKYYTFQ